MDEFRTSADTPAMSLRRVVGRSIQESTLGLQFDIIDERKPGGDVLYNGPSSGLTWQYLALGNPAGLPANATMVPLPLPALSKFDGNEFHLNPSSFVIDFAPARSGPDLDGKPRVVDLAKPNAYGPMDLSVSGQEQIVR